MRIQYVISNEERQILLKNIKRLQELCNEILDSEVVAAEAYKLRNFHCILEEDRLFGEEEQ